MFILYNASRDSYFLTTVPQMATAAIWNTLLPAWPPSSYKYGSSSVLGNPIVSYTRFPTMQGITWPRRVGQDSEVPRARIKLLTTPKDASGQTLLPVYRYSYTDGTMVAHALGTDIVFAPWILDGIEGYMYPPSIPQPIGTSKIYRWVKSPIKYVLIPEGDESIWIARGFGADGTGVHGFAYTNPSIFNDVPYGHYAQAEIEAMYHNQITLGCGSNPLIYCPAPSVTRLQMALFLIRAMRGPYWGPPNYTSIFADVPNGPNPPQHPYRNWIMQAYYDGLLDACPTSPGNFCPDTSITRNEMAKALVRAKYGSTYTPTYPSSAVFLDVPITPYNQWAPFIHQIYSEGITLGCAPGPYYCPTMAVSREAMALFISRTFGLLQ